MSKLSQLAQRIRILPEIGSELAKIAIARRVSQDSSDVANGLATVLRQAPYIDELTRGGMVDAVNESIAFSIAQARSLKKLVQRATFGSEKRISEHLDSLSNKKTAVERRRTELWAKVQAKGDSVATILQVAETVNLESVATLRQAATLFKQATASPPQCKADVDNVTLADARNKAAIANSGLVGNVKKILDGAITATGDPRLLLEEDVQTFLKDHPALWSALKLKLA